MEDIDTNYRYLFSYFINNGQDGLHLAFSEDGLIWTALNKGKAILKPKVGKNKLMRDPCIILGRNGAFHMVWTTGWRDGGIGLAHSKDLVNWSDQELLPVMEHESKALNCWAPELFYDDVTKQYLIFWSTTIPGRFPETEKGGDPLGKHKLNHRIYYTTTEDFLQFSETKLLYNDNFNVIDATMIRFKNRYLMVVKDETRRPVAKNLRVTTSDAAEGPYSPASHSFTHSWVEGPTILPHGDGWLVYYDQYTKNKFGCQFTSDFETWKDMSKQLKLPKNTRHGFAFTAPLPIVKNLIAKFPPKKQRKWKRG